MSLTHKTEEGKEILKGKRARKRDYKIVYFSYSVQPSSGKEVLLITTTLITIIIVEENKA